MIQWNTAGQRFFEDGLDRGVLYPRNAPGVAWNGLISVDEAPVGGDVTALHYDGDKYLDIVSNTDFQATITAFGAPEEFASCDGSQQLAMGLFVTQQPRRQFGLSYRTGIGNDEDDQFGYKIHLVYNCTAAPSTRARKTRTNEPSPEELQWTISTVPVPVSGFKATAHFVLDSRYVSALVLENVEEILYEEQRMPTPAELIDISAQVVSARIVEVEPNVWQLYSSTDTLSNVFLKPIVKPQTDILPFLWLNPTATGTYATIVTGG